jgi:hypothetical protein
MVEVKHDLRRLDDRIFQVLLIQPATLATALGSLVADWSPRRGSR